MHSFGLGPYYQKTNCQFAQLVVASCEPVSTPSPPISMSVCVLQYMQDLAKRVPRSSEAAMLSCMVRRLHDSDDSLIWPAHLSM